MGADDLEIARRFRIALEAAAKSGDREALYPFLAADVEWVTPKRTLRGIDEVREELIWGSPDENLDLEFDEGKWVELGDGRVVLDVHQVYRVKATGDFAYERQRQIELTIRDSQISRYEMRIVGQALSLDDVQTGRRRIAAATKMDMVWMLGVALEFVTDYQESVVLYPNIKTGAEFEGYEANASAAPP